MSPLWIPFEFPGGSDDKESACNAGDPGSIPGIWNIPWNGYLLQYSCQENTMARCCPGAHKGYCRPLSPGPWEGYFQADMREEGPALVFEGVYVDHIAPALSSLQVT